MSIRLPNSCFVHIPRTGGLWFGSVVEAIGIKHQTLRGDIDSHFSFVELPTLWRSLTGFSFVRHPFSWISSRWSHCIEHSLKQDYRNYGIHRLFDELVQPSFEETVWNIIKQQPGIVSYTYTKMTEGCSRLYQTESVRWAAQQIFSELESIDDPETFRIIEELPAFNGTARLEKYAGEIESLPIELKQRFMGLESRALKTWQLARKQEQST